MTNLITNNEYVIRHLSHQCRTYDGVTKLITSTKNRLQTYMTKEESKVQDEIMILENLQYITANEIRRLCKHYPIWNVWLSRVKGVGPFVGGNLILLYYYKFIPVCHKCQTPYGDEFTCENCGQKAKGEGILETKIERRDFPNVSKWWKFLGRSPHADGKLPKRKKGERVDWSPRGRVVTYHFGDQVNRQNENDPYKAFLLERKSYREKTHPKATKMHRLNMAKHETIQLFLSHFWHVARHLEKQSTEGPYIEVVKGHTGIIPPYYWDN